MKIITNNIVKIILMIEFLAIAVMVTCPINIIFILCAIISIVAFYFAVRYLTTLYRFYRQVRKNKKESDVKKVRVNIIYGQHGINIDTNRSVESIIKFLEG